MAERPSIPPPPAEADLLALVEGDPLPAARRAAIQAYLAADPAMARRLERMRRDMAELRAMGDEPAPAGLLAGVEAQLQPILERQMLMGISDGELVSDQPPISIVRPSRPSVFQAFFAERAGRRIAVAAGLLLLVGGGTYIAATRMSGSGQTPPVRIASRPPEAGYGTPMINVPATDRQEEPPAAASLALSGEEGEAPSARVAAASVTEPPPLDPVAEPAIAEVGVQGPPWPPPLTTSEAQALARERRLVVRVKAIDLGLLVNSDVLVTRLRRTGSGSWSVQGAAPQAIAAAVAQPFPSDAPMFGSPLPAPAYVGSRPASLPTVPAATQYGPPPPPLNQLLPEGPRVFLVQARLDAGSLESLRSALTDRRSVAQFEALDEPLPEEPPPLNNTAVFWWTQAPSGWTPWAAVPVVVDIDR
jgi:anti-sigma factor RsiW